MKIAALLITALLNIIIGIVLFFFLLLGMNGFSESQSTPGFILFIIWVVLTAVIAGILSFFTTKYLKDKKSLNGIVAGLISILLFVIVGGISSIAGLFVSVLLVSALR